MNSSERKHLLKWNTFLWLAAMVLPGIFSVALAGTRFPWPVLIPMLLLGPMLASNGMLNRALGTSADVTPRAE